MKNTNARIQYHRKRNGRTNYKKRLKLLQSRKPRLIIRRSNKYVEIQIAEYEPDGDKIIVGANSKALQEIGWKHSCNNIPASYLAGLLLAKKAKENKIIEAILDLGLQTPAKRSRLYAVLKGVIDGGIDVPASKDVFPSEERMTGKHISDKVAKDFESIKKKIK